MTESLDLYLTPERRFGELPEALQTSLRHASIEELDRIGERLLTARSLEEALDPR